MIVNVTAAPALLGDDGIHHDGKTHAEPALALPVAINCRVNRCELVIGNGKEQLEVLGGAMWK
jgi:hypothetical protein